MPVTSVKRGDKIRVIESATGKIARSRDKDGKQGKAVDGGGHATKAQADKQVNAINMNLNKKYRK